MIVEKKQIIFLFWLFCLPGYQVFSQAQTSKDNYTGAWETPASWDSAWPVPQTDVNSLDITIYGYITASNSLSFSGSSSKLIVEDTLVILGDLTINDDNDVQVNSNGILIVRGNTIVSDNSHIIADGYIIITGNIIKLGSTNNGSFLSNDNPVKVFVGGTISPTSLTINKPNFIAFNCSAPITIRYPHSGCSYGDMTDIITDPIYPFFQSTCTMSTLASSDADNSFCAGTSVTFTAGGGTNYNFRVNGTSVQNGGLMTYTTTTLTNGSIVDVIVSSTGGCTVLSAGITNTVFALPVAMATSNSPVCTGSPLTLTGGPAGMTTSWTGPAGFTANTQSPTVSPAATVAMAGIYRITVTNGCTSAAVTTTVVVNTLPVATATSNSPVCTGSPLILTGGPAGMTTYSWTGPNGFTANNQNPTLSPAATIGMAGIYNLTVTSADGCTSIATKAVTVNENPVANAGQDQELKFISETEMKAELSSSETGEWSVLSGTGLFDDIHSPVSRVTELSLGENIFLWKVRKGNCEDTTTVKIIVYDPFIPSVITPNGDGKNDYFVIGEIIDQVEIIIFNRWGNEEYSNSNYLNDWDGRNNIGRELPNDTYFYVLKFGNIKIKKGSVLIKR